MKTLLITGTIITEKTAKDYMDRMCKSLYGDMFDMAACQILEEIEKKVINAGLLTWAQIGEIESKYNDI